MIEVWTTDDAREALTRASVFLESEPVLHNLLLSLLVTRNTPATYVGVEDAGHVVGLARWDHDKNIVALSPMDDPAAVAIAPHLTALGAGARITGPAPTAATVVGTLTDLTRRGAVPSQGQRLYEHTEPQQGSSAPGAFRVATPDDVAILIAHGVGFDRAIDELRTHEQIEAFVTERIDAGLAFVWEDDGTVVSSCSATAPIADVSRVQAVYTPPESRGRGYAAACVGAATERLRDQGLRVALFTDLGNPTSNGIYRRLGYTVVAEYIAYRLLP